ncbi:MAG: hypothetical protein P4M08_04925 [Oligoflexia bacterium]|nr:hypothetical protein [Oligoflexia bacterium]
MYHKLSSLSLLIAFTLGSGLAPRPAPAVETSSGPTTMEGAEVLWHDAKKAYEEGLYDEAIPPIERLLSRYPGYPDAKRYRELRAWLGHAWLAQGKPEKAISPLQAYLEGAGRTDSSLWTSEESVNRAHARIRIVDAYTQLRKFQDALIAVEELKKDPAHNLTSELEARSLLQEARLLIALGRQNEAATLVVSASAPAQRAAQPAVLGEQRLLETELKAETCARFPSAKALEESETINQLDRRGICLEEAMLYFERLVNAKSETHSELARDLFSRAFKNYKEACANPPPSTKTKVQTTAQQKVTYREELAAKLIPACQAHAENAAALLRKWKATQPGPAGATSKAVNGLIQDLTHNGKASS